MNRERNYNKLFSANPQVGVLDPLQFKVCLGFDVVIAHVAIYTCRDVWPKETSRLSEELVCILRG